VLHARLKGIQAVASRESAISEFTGSTEHLATVLPVIATMRQQSHQAFSLDQLAEMAYLSRFHFNRVFSTVAGIPPVEFMTALRFDRAKQLLLSTDLSVTEVCFEVGFSSLGTFSSRFTQLVGVSPAEFRRLPELIDRGDRVPDVLLSARPGTYSHASVGGEVRGLDDPECSIYLGLFPKRFARGRPITGQLLKGTQTFLFPNLPNGSFTLLAAVMPARESLFDHLRNDRRIRVGAGESPVVIRTGTEQLTCNVQIRAPRPMDSPILVALPALVVS
jgi:AraC-like DNA-binding protein